MESRSVGRFYCRITFSFLMLFGSRPRPATSNGTPNTPFQLFNTNGQRIIFASSLLWERGSLNRALRRLSSLGAMESWFHAGYSIGPADQACQYLVCFSPIAPCYGRYKPWYSAIDLPAPSSQLNRTIVPPSKFCSRRESPLVFPDQ